MAPDIASRDNNQVVTLMAVSSVDGKSPVVLWADPTTHRLLVSSATSLASLSDVTITSVAQGDILYYNGTKWVNLHPGSNGNVLTSGGAGANPSWTSAGAGSVTSVSVTSANGFAGTVATATTTPAITISTTITGILKGNGTAISAATAGTDYATTANRLDQFATPNTDVAWGANKITGVKDPTSAQDAATKNYVDNIALGGVDWKQPAKYATTGALAANTYSNGVAGVGATLTGNSNGAISVDGQTPSVNDRILVKNEATASHNGVYVVTAVGSGAAQYVLTRATDYNTNTEIAAGDVVAVTAGSTLADTIWIQTSVVATVGTDAVSFSQFGALFPLAVANGGTGVSSASITAFNNITGFSAAGTTGTTSTNLVFSTSPTLVTPTLGVATATTINKLTITTPATGSTLTIVDGKTLTINNTLTLAGTDSTTMTFPSTSATIARTDAGQTFTGTQIMTSPKILTSILDTNGNTILGFATTASAVNYVKVTNAATGTAGPIIAPDGETNIDLKIAGKGTGSVHVTSGAYGDLKSDTDGATVTFDMSVSNLHTVTLGGNRTLALSNVNAGQIFVIRLVQDGTGSRTVTWFTTIKWAGGSAPTLTTTINKADTFVFICTSAGNYDGYVVGQNV